MAASRVDFYKCEDVPKTEAGEREIPLSQPIARSLKECRLRTRFARQDDLIFPNARGDYTGHQNMIHRQYKPLFVVIGEPPMNWHALRHFAISTWIEAGFSPKAVQTFAGHSSLQVTLDRYGHLFPAEDHSKMMNEIAVTLFADALLHGT
jgi:integrase